LIGKKKKMNVIRGAVNEKGASKHQGGAGGVGESKMNYGGSSPGQKTPHGGEKGGPQKVYIGP